MHSIRTALAAFFFLSVSLLAAGQKKGKKSDDSKVPDAYNSSVSMVKQALSFLEAGEKAKGDELIRGAIALYPVVDLFDYYTQLAMLPDIAGATTLIEQTVSAVQNRSDSKIYFKEPFPSTMVDGQMVALIKEYPKDRAIVNMRLLAGEVYRVFGEKKRVIKATELISQLKVTSGSPFPYYDYEKGMIEAMEITHLIYQKKYAEAVAIINKSELYKHEGAKAGIMLAIAWDKRDYASAISLAQQMMKTSDTAGHTWLFNIYSEMGEVENALRHEPMLSPEAKKSNGYFFNLAMLSFAKKNFNEALDYLRTSMSKRGSKGLATFMLVDKWKLYTSFAKAYEGIDDYSKAQENYNIALFYDDQYEPALEGKKSVEQKIAALRNTDKSGPSIRLTEPFAQRGLKPQSSSTLTTVKGIAEDPSGIAEVSINGKKVYSLSTGEFWDEVPLKDGLNKITVVAVDQTGNKTEQVFEIEKLGGEIQSTAKAGRNYALLLASQDYDDTRITALDYPAGDAIKLKLLLKQQYNFNEGDIYSFFNPTQEDIRRQFTELANHIQPDDNLIIFYSGQGLWSEKENKGYWLLADSKSDDPKSWISNQEILGLLAKLPARHTLLITDASFGGSVIKTRALDPATPASVRQLNEKLSRVVMTSGNPKPGIESVFMKHLLKALKENKEKYLTAQKLFVNHIIDAVMTESGTEPKYGTLDQSGHVGGDFIFIKN
jgi:hypothetical protein